MSTQRQKDAGKKAKLDGHKYEDKLVNEGYIINSQKYKFVKTDGYVPDIFGGTTRSKQDGYLINGNNKLSISVKKSATAWQLQDSQFDKIFNAVEHFGGTKAPNDVILVAEVYFGYNFKTHRAMTFNQIEERVRTYTNGRIKYIEKNSIQTKKQFHHERKEGRLVPSTIVHYLPNEWKAFLNWYTTNMPVLIKHMIKTGLCANTDNHIEYILFEDKEELGLIKVDDILNILCKGVAHLKNPSSTMISLGDVINIQRKSGGNARTTHLVRMSSAKLKKVLKSNKKEVLVYK